MNFRFLLHALVIGCLTVLSRTQTPVMLYPNGDSIIKTNEQEPGAGIVLEPGKTLVLQCNLTEAESHLQLSWLKDGQPISADKDIIEDAQNHSLTIKSANEKNHTGKYVCIAYNHENSVSVNATIDVTTRPGVKPFHKSMNLVQGDKLVLKCEFSGIPIPEIVWYIDDVENNGTDGHVTITTDMEEKQSLLKIDELEYEDRAEYSCLARSREESANTTILIRVKDRLAALWPFLGICAEVAILCTIIFVYEKKRSKPEFEDVDNDQTAENKNIQDHKEGSQDVRQRK